MDAIVFAGTPDFARIALDAILEAGYRVPLVLTQPDRPSGRGMQLRAGPVASAAAQAGIPVCQPRSLRLDGRYPQDAEAARTALLKAAPDVMVVAAYGLLLPQWVLDLPRLGCLNIHASLLPRWRGAAPIQRAIEAGDPRTGITIMQMDAGLDTGDMLLARDTPIGPEDNAVRLHDRLADLGAQAVLEALRGLAAGTLQPQPQPASGVTYAAKLDKSEARLDFDLPAALLERRIRAFDPAPGATMVLPGLKEPVKVWRAEALPGPAQGTPGQIESVSPQGIDIASADGILRVLELQKAGGRRQHVSQFILGWQHGGHG